MSNKPNRTCEPVMVNKEDVDLVDGIVATRYGKGILDMARRKELVKRRKEVFHELIEAGWKYLGQLD